MKAISGYSANAHVVVDVPEIILERIYEAAGDDTAWSGALSEIAEWVGASGAIYWLMDRRMIGPDMKAIYAAGYSSDATARYAKDQYLADPHVPIGMQTPPATWFYSQDHFDNSFIARNAFFQEVMNPLGVRWVAGSRIWEGSASVAGLAFQRSVDARPFAELDRARLAAVTTHLSRATRIHDRLMSQGYGAGLGLEAMNNLKLGVAVLDSSARAMYSNAAAEEMFAQDKRFRCLPCGRVTLAHAGSQNAFRDAISATATLDSAALRILDRDGKHVINSVVVPMPAAARLNAHWQRPLIMLVMREVNRVDAVAIELFYRLFGLSPAESSVANWLATGRSINEYADQRGVSVETVRTQVKAILSKTGVRRQAELVAYLARLPAI